MALSWFYELTPDGFKREGEVEVPETVRYSTGRKLVFAIIAVLSLAVVLLLAHQFVLHRDGKDATSETAVDRPIAALPFHNLGADKDNGFFADAPSLESVNSLARMPKLQVASRTASFAFRDSNKATADIAAKLRVATLLEGSVQYSGDKLRVTVQLIRAADGFELWLQDHDRSNNDVIAVDRKRAENRHRPEGARADAARGDALRARLPSLPAVPRAVLQGQ
ncbi:MAG: hypothetical protein JSR34_04515 [Proteobacteria bacterium]|nr:hypothetical protein [Pseudomonadota bacterium]